MKHNGGYIGCVFVSQPSSFISLWHCLSICLSIHILVPL